MIVPGERYHPASSVGYKQFGVFEGRVEKVDDPLKMGRMKVRVHQIHALKGQTPTKALPWAMPAFTYPIQWGVPPIGTRVYVAFVNGVIDNPVVLGICHSYRDGVSSAPLEGQFSDDKPTNYVLKTPNGKTIELNDHPNTPYIKVKDEHGNYVLIDLTTDTLTVNILKDANVIVGRNANVHADGTITITANSTVTIVGSVVSINP